MRRSGAGLSAPARPEPLAGEGPEARRLRLAADDARRLAEDRATQGRRQAALWEASAAIVVGRVERVRPARVGFYGPGQSALVRPVRWIKGEGRARSSRRPFWLRHAGETSCGPYGGGDAVDGKPGELFVLFAGRPRLSSKAIIDWWGEAPQWTAASSRRLAPRPSRPRRNGGVGGAGHPAALVGVSAYRPSSAAASARIALSDPAHQPGREPSTIRPSGVAARQAQRSVCALPGAATAPVWRRRRRRSKSGAAWAAIVSNNASIWSFPNSLAGFGFYASGRVALQEDRSREDAKTRRRKQKFCSRGGAERV